MLLSVLRWSALVQPFLGVIADRQDARYWIILAPTVTAIGMSFLGLAPNYLALVVLLTLAGLSHAAFHPAVARRSPASVARNWGMGTSFWMTGGELGRAVGPLFIVAVIGAVGLEGSWIAIGPAIVASLLLYWRIGKGQRLRLGSKPPNLFKAVRQAGRPLAILAATIILRNLGSASFTFFFPTYVVDVTGGSVWFAATAITVFELAAQPARFAAARSQIVSAGATSSLSAPWSPARCCSPCSWYRKADRKAGAARGCWPDSVRGGAECWSRSCCQTIAAPRWAS